MKLLLCVPVILYKLVKKVIIIRDFMRAQYCACALFAHFVRNGFLSSAQCAMRKMRNYKSARNAQCAKCAI